MVLKKEVNTLIYTVYPFSIYHYVYLLTETEFVLSGKKVIKRCGGTYLEIATMGTSVGDNRCK